MESDFDFFFLTTCIGSIVKPTPAKADVKWVMCEELHFDATTHFYMAIKLDRQQRWLAIRDCIHLDFQIKINFSGDHRTVTITMLGLM